LTPINILAMVEKFGNQELIEQLAGPLNAAIAVVQPLLKSAQAAQEQTKQAQVEQLGKTVQEFFTSKDMAPYAKAYGTDLRALTSDQVETRGKVLEMADALISGAEFQGRKLSAQDALVLAHDSIASGMKETVIRDQIRSKVEKRARGITLKPTAQGQKAGSGPPRDRQELLGRTEDRLSAAFG
jgi:hypothetical protein